MTPFRSSPPIDITCIDEGVPPLLACWMRPWLCMIFVLSGLLLVHAEEGLIPEVHRSPQGTMEISFEGKSDSHYLLYRSLDLAEQGESIAMALGEDGAIHLKDRLHPTPKQVYYRVHEVPNTESGDTDGDGKLDYNEMRPTIFAPNVPSGNPFNPIKNLKSKDGSYLLTESLWEEFAVRKGARGITDVLTGQSFIKFVGMPFYEAGPLVVFMNTKRHNIHGPYLDILRSTYKIPNTGELRGEMALIADESGKDWYVFNLQPQNAPSFEHIRLLYHLLTANMPFIDGNLAYRPLDSTLLVYRRDQHLYDREGIPIWLDEERDRPGFNDYVSLNEGETYGLLRVFDSDERPSIIDVALYRQLPNDVPLLRGIITETPQTPLSHVNLRAVQNHNPNAYIRGASNHPEIKPLIGKYVRYAVRPDGFEISEATREEVEAHLEALRPKESQLPPRDLEQLEILPLGSLGFARSSSIGAKAANLAQLMTAKLAIPRVVFPEMGYAIPFHYYDAFMKHNDFYETAASMISTAGFLEDPLRRDEALKDLRQTIKGGEMPAWMLESLAEVQNAFPTGQGIRCRSSTNNEDLPGFNGAGLYDSFTHHPDEGHLSKSVKQVFASLWRFLAFEHREFYRVDHFQAAMGVLLHPNYEGEQANGVAVSRHGFGVIARHPYYANSQVGENLVTNPGILSQPEELLLSDQTQGGGGFTLAPIRFSSSNQVPLGEQVLTDKEGEELAEYLRKIVSHFRRLYDEDSTFAMEIEFKITKDRQLLIKQARPWVN
ncbi:MAG: hypothetical protein ACI8T1_000455 [Verrucomicrobiales bacterium]